LVSQRRRIEHPSDQDLPLIQRAFEQLGLQVNTFGNFQIPAREGKISLAVDSSI
jgi:hypothetical protein